MAEMEKDGAIKMAQLIRRTVEDLKIPHKCSPVSMYITISIGVTSVIPNKNSSPKDLFLLADKALYQAKTAGRNKVVFLSKQKG